MVLPPPPPPPPTAVTFILPNDEFNDDDDLLVSSPPPLPMKLRNDSIDDLYNNNDDINNSNEDYDNHDHDIDDSTSTLLQMRYPYYNNPSNIGLRERTTSQSSVGDIMMYNNSRDRTFSQNSVEQLESQSMNLRRNTIGKNVSVGSSSTTFKGVTRSSSGGGSGIVPLLSSTTTSKYSSSSSLQTIRNHEWLRSFVESIQSMQVPIWMLRYYRNKQKHQQPQFSALGKLTKATAVPVTHDSIGDSSNSSKLSPPLLSIDELQQQQHSKPDIDTTTKEDDDRTVVHWIQGLDRVLFHKETCCAQEIRLLGWKPPRYAWFALSGAMCDILQLGMLYLLHVYILPTNMDTSISWMVAFCTSILFRHTSHRFFVFGTYVGGYTHSLVRIYMGYSVTIVLSTILNYILNRILAVNLFLLAILTMAWTGVVNYFILKYFWNIGSSTSSKSTINNTSAGSSTILSSSNKQNKHAIDMIDSQSLTATTINAKS
jgi:putative flippase GtrA